MSETAQFKLYIQLELEKRITAMEDLGFEEDKDAPVKIAQITFAYYNGEVIRWLTKRGDLIKTEKWDKVKEINDEIAEGISKNGELLDRCQKPCSVFATFETEEGYNRAIIYNEQPQMSFLNGEIEIQEASEPTDIIWENRQFKPWQRTNKRLVVYFIIIVMLAISATVIFLCTKSSNAAKFKYPTATCSITEDDYKTLGNKTWLTDAMNEYSVNTELSAKGLNTHYTDILQCYCTNQKTIGADYEGNYTATLFNGTSITEPIC